jgi:hypothetical protein
MRVVRLTRHVASEEQLRELRRIYGEDVEVVEVSETVPNVGRVKEIVIEHGADVLEAVLPLPVIAEAVNPHSGIGIPVIRAKMTRILDESGSNATFTLSHYEQVERVVVETKRL